MAPFTQGTHGRARLLGPAVSRSALARTLPIRSGAFPVSAPQPTAQSTSGYLRLLATCNFFPPTSCPTIYAFLQLPTSLASGALRPSGGAPENARPNDHPLHKPFHQNGFLRFVYNPPEASHPFLKASGVLLLPNSLQANPSYALLTFIIQPSAKEGVENSSGGFDSKTFTTPSRSNHSPGLFTLPPNGTPPLPCGHPLPFVEGK